MGTRCPRAVLGPLSGLTAALLCGQAAAVGVGVGLGGTMRVHAVIGQPLAVIVPLSFSGSAPGAVEVRVEPEPGLAEAEEAAAQTVRASYDAKTSQIRLSTTQRLVVPAIRLHLTVASGAFLVEQGFDVLVDLPDFNRQFDRGEAGAGEERPQEIETAGIRLLTIPSGNLTPAWGDAAAHDLMRPAADRPQVSRAAPGWTARPPSTYAVRPGDTLSTIAAHLAKTYKLPPAPMKLALYESNPQAFRPSQPERPAAGARLRVPDPVEVASQPASRVAAFSQFASHPARGWQVPAADAELRLGGTEPAQAGNGRAMDRFWRGVVLASGAAALLLLGAVLWSRLRRLRLPRIGLRMPKLNLRRTQQQKTQPDAAPPDPVLQQEIGRLRGMLIEKPWRSDIRFQLAQRLYKAGDAAGFAEVAPELKASLSVGVWQRIRAMGQELLRDDPRFA